MPENRNRLLKKARCLSFPDVLLETGVFMNTAISLVVFISGTRIGKTDAPVLSWEDPFALVRPLSCTGPCRKVCLRGRDAKCPGHSPGRCPPRISRRYCADQPDLYRTFWCPPDPGRPYRAPQQGAGPGPDGGDHCRGRPCRDHPVFPGTAALGTGPPARSLSPFYAKKTIHCCR